MDRKNELLEELIKEIKSKEEFYAIKDQLFKRGIETLLNAEMTLHLGYPKNQKATERRANSRNGTTPKVVKTSKGEVQVDIPRDRSGDFDIAKLRAAEKSRKCADVSRSRPHLRMQSGDPMWRRMAPHRFRALRSGGFRKTKLSTSTELE